MKHIFIIIFFCAGSNLHAQWFEQHVLTDMNIPLSIDFYDLNTGVTCGRNDSLGKVVYTTNGGTNWISGQLPDSTRACVTVQFINSHTAYIAGAYNLYNSAKPIKNRALHKIAKLPESLANYLYMIGHDNSAEYKGLFLKTTNGGQNWFTYGDLHDSVYYLIGMHFLNLTTGYVTGDKSESAGEAVMLKTTNGGMNWSYQNIPQGIHTLRNILFLDFSTGFAVGYRQINDTLFQSVILKTVNGGAFWSEVNIPGMENIDAIDFPNSSTGFAAAFYGSWLPYQRIYKTTNTGLNWLQSSGTYQAYIGGIEFLSGSGTGFSYGTWFNMPDSSFVIRTTDYGQSWYYQSASSGLPVGVFLTESCIADLNNWYLCGGGFPPDNGVILKTTNGGGPIGVKPVGNEMPDQFMLHQNYPNPFNPVTRIRFDVPPYEGGKGDVKGGFVTLTIYDILGRETAVLVNPATAGLKPGTYEVEWDASNYPSGVYFYKLTASDFTDVKKMILLK